MDYCEFIIVNLIFHENSPKLIYLQYQLTWPGLGVRTVVASFQNSFAEVCSMKEPSRAASILVKLNAHIADAGVPVLQ